MSNAGSVETRTNLLVPTHSKTFIRKLYEITEKSNAKYRGVTTPIVNKQFV